MYKINMILGWTIVEVLFKNIILVFEWDCLVIIFKLHIVYCYGTES